MKHLLGYLKDYKKECVLGPLFKLLEASFELLVPLVIAAIIDRGIGAGDRGCLYRMCGVLVLLAVVGLACSLTAQYFAARAATGFAAGVRMELFSHIQSLSYTELDRLGTSTLITRMTSDVNQLQNGVNLVLRLFLRSPFIVFGAMVMAFTVDGPSAWIFVVTIPLLSVVVFGIMYLSMPLYRRVQGGLDRILGRTRENLAGVRVIRAFRRERREQEEFAEDNEALLRLQLLVGRLSALTNPVTFILINTALIALILLGAGQVDTGGLTQGEVVALVNYMSQILVELIKLANLIVTVSRSLTGANRVAEALSVKSTLTEREGSAQGEPMHGGQEDCIVFDHVGMTYADAPEEALSDLTFTVKRGQTVGIIGGTGSGKTSLVNLIPRFYDVSSGAVYVDGKDVRDYAVSGLREKIGLVPQRAVLFSGTIADNLRWGKPDVSDEALWEALRLAQAEDIVSKKADGLAGEVEEGGKNLSGGQRQRLTIARALVRDPEILILDDSASALDAATDARLREALAGLRDKTILIVSQRTASIRGADVILVLDDGRIAGIGTHDALISECAVYREIYESQFRGEEATGR